MHGSANLNLMIATARKAARGLSRDFREIQSLQSSIRGTGDFAGRAIAAAERILREELRGTRANYGWTCSEGPAEDGEDPTRRWIVDPLCGRTNYLHGLPRWSVSLALEHKREIVSGVVFDPERGELFLAEKGQGAWMNDRRLRVSARKRIAESLLATALPSDGMAGPTESASGREPPPACADARRLGAASLDLACVAAGRIDGYWGSGLRPWDMAAGAILVREAGGFVAPLRKDGDYMADGEIVAANPTLFEGLVEAIRQD